MGRCDVDEWAESLGRAVRAATPHLLVAAHELAVAGLAFLDALTRDGGSAARPVRERIPVVD